MNILKTIIYKILSIQETILRKQLSKTIGIKHKSKKKRHYLNGCTVDLSTLAIDEKNKLEEELNNILKTYNYEPLQILRYIQKQGTRVIYTDNVKKALNAIGDNEGFVYPATGSKALYLSLAFDKKFRLKTPEMFIISKGPINKYYFIYHLYNWFAFKHNISGMDTASQDLLKKYLFDPSSDINELQLADIYSLKDAIQQDKAAIEFVIKLCRNFEGTKQAIKKIKENGSANL